MDRKSRRTIIAISDPQPALDFADRQSGEPFTFPEYQKGLLWVRTLTCLIDLAIAGATFGIFVLITQVQIVGSPTLDRRIIGAYVAGFLVLLVVYFFLFMLSESQTPGMKAFRLTVVDAAGQPLDPPQALLRGFGYLISIIPFMLGLLWAFIDPEHLTWTDKVSETFLKKL